MTDTTMIREYFRHLGGGTAQLRSIIIPGVEGKSSTRSPKKETEKDRDIDVQREREKRERKQKTKKRVRDVKRGVFRTRNL